MKINQDLHKILCCLFLFLPTAVTAQTAAHRTTPVGGWDDAPVIINVGEIQFQQPKKVDFQIWNTSKRPMRVRAVHPSCGCTDVEWAKSPVAPNESATISVTYDAQQLGSFQKEVEVKTDISGKPKYLILQGNVVTKVTDYQKDYPIDLGAVRLSTNNLEFEDVNNGDNVEAVLRLVNTGRKPYKPQLMHLPSYLTARYEPEVLSGGRAGRIVLTLNSRKLSSYGLTQTSIYLARYMGDKVSSENEIEVSAVLLPGFSHLTAEQIRKAPKLSLSEEVLDFSNFKGKAKLTKMILVSNNGQTPLNVSRVQVYGKSLTVKLSDRSIKPGKQAKLKVTVEASALKKDKVAPRVLLITDDPQKPKTVVKLNY